MEAMSLILTAVVAGESKTEANTMLGAVEDDFAGLHTALRTRLDGHPEAQAALEQYISHPEDARDPLITGLRQSGAVGDAEVLRYAVAVMRRIDPEGCANGTYTVDRV